MSNSSTQAKELSQSWQLCLMAVLSAAAIMLPDLVYAAAQVPLFEGALCNITLFLTSNTGKALATIAVTIIGIGALLGKVSWGMALLVGIGIAVIFGAASIVDAISGDAAVKCSGTKVDIVP